MLPGFIGMANNGDFGKVTGYFCLIPRGAETNFIYFQPAYVWHARNFWDSPYHSSESALAWVATRLAGATKEGAGFDIRWMGAIHAALFLGALAVLMAGLRGTLREMPRWAAAAMAVAPVLIFTDVLYAANLNSFFMDTAALCGLMLMTASAVWMALEEEPSVVPVSIFAAAALLFATSKVQHAIWMVLPAAWLFASGIRMKARHLRRFAYGAAIVVLLSGAWMLATVDPSYRGQAMFNLLFYRLGPRGADLTSLGVAPQELRYIGMHSYIPGAPASDQDWTDGFYRRTGFARLLGWYARHPGTTLGLIRDTAANDAAEMRQNNLSNFRVEAGHPPGARTQRFAAWSSLRGELLRRWPWHIAVWYALFAAGCLYLGSRVAWVALGVAALGAGEFLAASLADCLETARHLLLFQAATDLTLCFAVGWAIHQAIHTGAIHTKAIHTRAIHTGAIHTGAIQKMIRHTP